MISDLAIKFILLIVVCTWLSSEMDTGTKLVISGTSLATYIVAMWVDTIFLLGIRSFRSISGMAYIFGKSKKGSMLIAMFSFCMIILWSPYSDPPSQHRILMTSILLFSMVFLWIQPPAVLLLGESNAMTGQILRDISVQFHPLRTVSLLDISKAGPVTGSSSPLTDNLRTQSSREWRSVIDILSKLVPMIVVDTRTDSKFVKEEVERILKSSSTMTRALFLVPTPACSFAAFDVLESHKNSSNAKRTTESDLTTNLKVFLLNRVSNQRIGI